MSASEPPADGARTAPADEPPARDAGALLAAAAHRAPGVAALFDVPAGGGTRLPGHVLHDRGWIAAQVDGSARRYRTADRRVAATLWWYSVSTVLPAASLATAVLSAAPVDPRAPDLLLAPGSPGRPVAAVPVRRLPDADTGQGGARRLAGPLRELFAGVIGLLADEARVRPRPLWAVAADSLAGLALRLGREAGREAAACAATAELASAVGPPMPVPRWVDVAVPDGSDGLLPVPPAGAPDTARFVRRGSCCLIYRAPGEELCTSCPRRRPAERAVLLELAASRLACGS